MNSQNLDQVRQEFDPFFAGLAFYDRVWRAAKQKLDVCLASDFNVFNYIQPNENTISGIIADLLNPRGSHGQGVIFLQKFLELLKDEVPSKSKQELQNAVVICEATTSFISNRIRRIDIRIEISKSFGIGIENKPWAVDQQAQLADYRQDLERRYPDGFVLLYLCQQGGMPGPQSLKPEEKETHQRAHQFKILYYSDHIQKWLNECIKEVQADKVRWFLRDFHSYIEEHLSGVLDEETIDK